MTITEMYRTFAHKLGGELKAANYLKIPTCNYPPVVRGEAMLSIPSTNTVMSYLFGFTFTDRIESMTAKEMLYYNIAHIETIYNWLKGRGNIPVQILTDILKPFPYEYAHLDHLLQLEKKSQVYSEEQEKFFKEFEAKGGLIYLAQHKEYRLYRPSYKTGYGNPSKKLLKFMAAAMGG